MKFIEVEQKYHVDNHKELRDQLKVKGAARIGQSHQVDVYYNAPHRDFLAAPRVNEWLRLRKEGDKASINFKLWMPLDSDVKTHCEEFESSVGDVEAVGKLLELLDFPMLITVDKRREEWKFGDIVVALDTVEELGNFVEFEYHGTANNVDEAHKAIYRTIKELHVSLGKENLVGYPYMLLTDLIKERRTTSKTDYTT